MKTFRFYVNRFTRAQGEENYILLEAESLDTVIMAIQSWVMEDLDSRIIKPEMFSPMFIESCLVEVAEDEKN